MRRVKLYLSYLVLSSAAVAVAQPQTPKFTAKLYADHDGIQPGGETELAIELTVEKDWHVYHPVILGTGAPTTIEFDLPTGASVGDLHFPTPTLDSEQAEKLVIEYLSLDGRPVVLTTLKLAEGVVHQPLVIKAQVKALACKKLCLPVEAEASLTLNVTDQEPAPANEKLFQEARENLPNPFARAEYLEGSRLLVSHTQVPVGGRAALVAVIRVRAGHHIQDRDPGVEGLIPTRLFVESVPGVKFNEKSQVWPKPKVRDMPGFGKVREQSGECVIQAPFEINDAKFKPGPVRLRALLQYQCCTDKGECYPPAAAEGFFEFEVVPAAAPAVANADPLIAKLPPLPPPAVAGPAPTGATRTTAETVSAAQGDWANLLAMIGFGFLGGLLLNIMPCVFPVISIKIISFVKQAGEDRGRVLRLGLAFCAGIMAWFWIFAVLTSQGQIPWQHPPVVIGLAAILFALALNLFGVFEITLPGGATGKLDEFAGREGYSGAFLKGMLATLLGTACTAPFFASAAAFAATQPPSVGFTIFTSAGVGMSFPYVLLAAFPGWLKFLPKPGPWMVVFKQVMGFVLIGTVVWLMLTIGDLLDARGVVWTACFLAFLGFALWLLGQIKLNWGGTARFNTWLAALGIVIFGWWFSFVYKYNLEAAAPGSTDARIALSGANSNDPAAVIAAVTASSWNDHIPWQPYRPGLAEELCRRGYTVYVDYTATWCVTCQTNKATALEIGATRSKMRALSVVPIKADYTRRDPGIRADLLRFGHNSVPLNLIYPSDRPEDVIKLPVLLTPGIVHDALDRAGPSRPKAATSGNSP